jgi:hypothetical protein
MDITTAQSSADLDTAKLWINFAASVGLTGLMAAFLIFLFGRDNSAVYKMPAYKTIALKAGMAMCTAGALLNAVTMSNPPWSEVLLNSGLCTLFAWAAWFHYGRFVKPWQEEEAAKRLETAIKATKPAMRQQMRKAARKATK